MPLFGKSQKSPAELVKVGKIWLLRNFSNSISFVDSQALKEALKALEALKTLERGDKKAEKVQEDVSKNLVSARKSAKSHCETQLYRNTLINRFNKLCARLVGGRKQLGRASCAIKSHPKVDEKSLSAGSGRRRKIEKKKEKNRFESFYDVCVLFLI